MVLVIAADQKREAEKKLSLPRTRDDPVGQGFSCKGRTDLIGCQWRRLQGHREEHCFSEEHASLKHGAVAVCVHRDWA